MLDLMFDPKGMRPFIANWAAVAESLIQRVYRESVSRVVDDTAKALLARLLAYPDVEPARHLPAAMSAQSVMPMISIDLVHDGRLLRYFSMVTTVGTPQTVAAQELRVECMFPADDETEALHLDWVGDALA
jgi:hypothetical protein